MQFTGQDGRLSIADLTFLVHAQLEEGLEKEVKEVEYALENDLTSFGKGFTVIEKVRCLAVHEAFLWCS